MPVMDENFHKPNFHHYNGSKLYVFLFCFSFYLLETLERKDYHKIPPMYFPFPLKKIIIFTLSWSKKPYVIRQLVEAVTHKADGKLPSFQQSSSQS